MQYQPISVAVLNLMPEKAETEEHIRSLLPFGQFSIETTLLTTATYRPKHTPQAYLKKYYKTLPQVEHQLFDLLVITGAPIAHLPFEKIAYWHELTEIFEWSKTHARRVYTICWAAMAALYYFYGIEKYTMPRKLVGIYSYTVNSKSRVFSNIETIDVPQSRYSALPEKAIQSIEHLNITLSSNETGVCMVEDYKLSYINMLGHLEYDTYRLAREYRRDQKLNRNPVVPHNYFADNQPGNPVTNTWHSSAQHLFYNWLKEKNGQLLPH